MKRMDYWGPAVLVSVKHLYGKYLTMSIAWYTISDWSTPMTFLAPARAANMERIPVPQPTSSTTLSLNRVGLWYMKSR